jgi:chromosome segregation ATPase
MNTKKLIGMTLASALLLAPAWLLARQDQSQDSVVEAARKAQEAKKTAPKAKMTIDNDNLDTLTGTVNVVGQEPTVPADAGKTAPNAAKGEKPAVKGEAYWRKTFAAANKKLADDAHELDILQRELNLKQQQYYSDPNQAMKQEYTRQDLNDSKQKIDDMTAAVAQDKQDIADLEDALHQAGGDPGWEREAAPQDLTEAPAQTPAPVQADVPAAAPPPDKAEVPAQAPAQTPAQ